MLSASDGHCYCDGVLEQEVSRYFEITEAIFCKETDIKGVNYMQIYVYF